MKDSSSIAHLPFMSPVSIAMLARIGVESVEQLRELGAIEVYLRLKRNGGAVSVALLWALEAGASGTHITRISTERRAALLAAIAEQGS